MKKYLLLLLVVAFSFSLFSQTIDETTKEKHFIVGVGFGDLYGGQLGIQANFKYKFVGITFGTGVLFTRSSFYDIYSDAKSATNLMNGGIRLYYKNLYLSLTYGSFGYGVYKERNQIDNYSYSREDIAYGDYYAIGPLFDVGYNWYLFKNFGVNIYAGISYNTVEPRIDWEKFDVQYKKALTNFGIGLIYSF